ncbi:glutamyl-tRNA reductase [Natranaerofaba carboxydovora]|uniref:glutamyl-tRNA reductase n=1 Tax=Natranaerofaba carboxydovora TaxID=2742683 RepID=UPI001F130FE7|nr:glutamyl-tRNA reductase [Natranaerofaba carboxydovora]UMZ73202.1 Glutamyl-tRNA reductase [Natranaerofaba carboxydovora]
MEDIILLGLNHKTADVEVREKLALTPDKAKEFINLMIKQGIVTEGSIMSTCNRTEIYAMVEEFYAGKELLVKLLSEFCDVKSEEFEPHLYTMENQKAVYHLFQVASGLDSMILGETQILGQVREAYKMSDECGGVGSCFHGLFQHALSAGKRVHSETQINDNAASVSYAAVELARDIFGTLENKTVLLIGAGKMSELTAKHLNSDGANVVVVNRTIERAKECAKKIRGQYAPYEELSSWLHNSDILISSTGAPHYVVNKSDVKKAMEKRNNKPMFLIDIAVPRDIEPEIKDFDNVHLHCIDDLQNVVESNMEERREEADNARMILHEEVAEFMVWYKTRDVVPLISALRKKAEGIRTNELERYDKKLKNLSKKERNAVEGLTKSLVNRILKEPVLRIKNFAVEDKSDIYGATLAHLFDLDESLVPKSDENEPIELDNESKSFSNKLDENLKT